MTSITALTPPAVLLEHIHNSQRPLLIAHIAPDGDAIGSLLATGLILYRLGKEPILACQDRRPNSLQFLPFQDKIINQVFDQDIDLVISLDSSDAKRMGDIYDARQYGNLPLLVIDHHITNTQFGSVNWVEPSAAATAEIIYYLCLALGAEIQADLATCILTGLVTDTRGFRTNNTTARVMNIAATLMEAGAPLNKITEQALNTRSYELIQLWARALESLALDGGVISVVNAKAMRSDLGRLIRADGLASFILGAHEANIAALFTELPDNRIECSFRARPGNDVATVAFEFGGGGHPLAAGCTIDGRLEEVRTQVVARLQGKTELATSAR